MGARRCSEIVAQSLAWRDSALAAPQRASRLNVMSGRGTSEHTVSEVRVAARTFHLVLDARWVCKSESSQSDVVDPNIALLSSIISSLN